MNGSHETKSEIRARIDELVVLMGGVEDTIKKTRDIELIWLRNSLEERIGKLRAALDEAEEDTSTSIIRSHKAICKVKQMEEKAAYGNDPAVYYTLGVCGEAGEMANAIVKALRNGLDREKILNAVKSELPDVIIYSYVLAYVLDIDLSKLVNEKVDVVVRRAHDGYYGAPLPKGVPGASP